MKKLFLSLSFLFVLAQSGLAQINNEHLNIGEEAPRFQAVDQNGANLDSDELLKEGKVLLVFFRGSWCPYCNKHLASLEENFVALTQKGVSVVVVTPERMDMIQEANKEWNASYSIVHDAGDKIMKAYKVAFEVNEVNVPNYYNAVQKRIQKYNEENSNTLPVPATYVIDQNHKISYVHYDPDYKNRSNIEALLEEL